ncbi:MAG: hypothetical protein ACREEZ_01540 [Stellaceae bacterium]
MEKARDVAAQVHHAAEKVYRQAEETRRLSGETRRRSEQTRALVRSNRRETDAASGAISQGLDEAAGAGRVLCGESRKRDGG